MKKKSLKGLSLNKKTVSNLNKLDSIKGGGSIGICGTYLGCYTQQTCIGSGDPNCGLGTDSCITRGHLLCNT